MINEVITDANSRMTHVCVFACHSVCMVFTSIVWLPTDVKVKVLTNALIHKFVLFINSMKLIKNLV